jgi:hypothetical protein
MQIDTMRMCFNTSDDMQASPTEDTNSSSPYFVVSVDLIINVKNSCDVANTVPPLSLSSKHLLGRAQTTGFRSQGHCLKGCEAKAAWFEVLGGTGTPQDPPPHYVNC